jgi:hypothetical protein
MAGVMTDWLTRHKKKQGVDDRATSNRRLSDHSINIIIIYIVINKMNLCHSLLARCCRLKNRGKAQANILVNI